jgi:transcriptional regulator with XRE-family HTH domain
MSEEWKSKLEALPKGLTLRQISERLGVSRSCVYYRTLEFGYEPAATKWGLERKRKSKLWAIAEATGKSLKWVQNQRLNGANCESVEGFIAWRMEFEETKTERASAAQAHRRVPLEIQKAKASVRGKIYNSRPEVKAARNARNRTPEKRAKLRAYQNRWNAKRPPEARRKKYEYKYRRENAMRQTRLILGLAAAVSAISKTINTNQNEHIGI